MLKGKNPYIDNLLVIIYYDDNSKLIVSENKIEFDTTYFFQGIVRYYNDIGLINQNNIENVLFTTYKNLFLLLEIPYNRTNRYFLIKKIRLFMAILKSRDNLKKLSEKYSLFNFLEYYNEMIGKLNYLLSFTTENKNIKMSFIKKEIKKKEIIKNDFIKIKDYPIIFNFCNDLVTEIIDDILSNLITQH